MPELTAHSTATQQPLPPSQYAMPPEEDDPPAHLAPLAALAAAPPVVDPAEWEDFAVFRETFLMYITPPGYAAALRKVGEMLFTMILESHDQWPGWPESSTRMELRAAVADLRHLEGFLQSVGREREVSSLAPEDAYLSRIAGKLAPQLGKLAGLIEEKLKEAEP